MQEDSPSDNDLENCQFNHEYTNEVFNNLQLQIEDLSSQVDNIGDNQETVNRKLFALLSKSTREKIEDQSFSFVMQDTYAFIMVDPYSLASLVAWLVFVLQIGCFLLAVSKYFVTSQFTLKKVSFPKGVDKSVSAGQIINIFLILVVQQALWESIGGISNGYLDNFKNHGVKRNWWLVSMTLRLIEGLIASFVTFWLVLQSDNVLELFKDFTAIAFVSSLDNLIFVIANMGVLGSRVNNTIDKCNKFSQHIRTKHASNIANRNIKAFSPDFVRYLLFHPFSFALILLLVLYGIWAEHVFFPQVNGRFLCQQLYLQLDDDVNFQLSYFSGSYKKLEGEDKRGWYPAYREFTSYEAKNKRREPNMILRFCENLNSWVFTLERRKFEEECDEAYALVRSTYVENQQKFDLLEVSETDWFVKDLEEDKWINLNNFVRDCEDGGPKYDPDDSEICKSLIVDEREEVFVGARLWSNKFIIMEKDSKYITLYNHPIYTNDITNKGQEQELIVFLGKRWAMMSANDLKDNIDGTDLFSFFRTRFHARWSDYNVAFFSEPITSDSTRDKMSPVGSRWVTASPKIAGQNQQAEDNRKQRSIFLCGQCHDETNPCFYEGICLPDKSCHCTNDSTGALCQVLPTQNGHCNNFFNERDYSYDGGDCCEHTCVSDEYKCGRDESGLFYVGYDLCETDTCTDCWRPSLPSPSMKDLIVTDVSLSPSGRVLGLIESVGKTARVYESQGSRWIMRGSVVMMIDEPSSSIIQVMGREDILNDRLFSFFTVAIITDERVHVFGWNKILWSEHERHIFNNASSLPMQLELKNNGNSLGVLYENDFRLFIRDHSSLSWKDVTFELNSSGIYKYVSLSKNAKKVILANKTCADMHDLLNKVRNTKCDFDKSRAIKQIVLSPNGQKLGILFERESQGEVAIYHVENNTFLERGNALRAISVENAKIEVSNDGNTIASYSDTSNVVKIHQFLNNKWQMTGSMSSKNMALSSNQKVMATISPTTGYLTIFHRNTFCEEGFTNIRLSFITDDHPDELMWELLNITASGEISTLKKGGPYDTSQTMIVEELCVDNNVLNNTDLDSAYCIGLRVVDLGLDGLKSPGKIGISINGTMILTMDETDGYDNIYRVVGFMDCLEFVKEDLPWPRKYNPSLHMECFTDECEWNKIGSVNRSPDVNNEGEFISMSADGLILSIGYKRNNQVQILKYNDISGWTQYGANITVTGQDNDMYFGWATSLSADGSKVAISAYWSNVNGDNSGEVRLYAFNEMENNWSQYGNTINGPQAGARLGNYVSLSANGSVFATSNGNWYNLYLPCDAYIYEYSIINDEWVPRGGCIGDEGLLSYANVKLSSNGLVIAMGYVISDVYTGSVRVYRYNSFTKEWEQLGNDIKGDGISHVFSNSLEISSNGLIMVVGGWVFFPAKAYIFDEGKNDWRQMGQSIVTTCNDRDTWYDMSLSSDGTVWFISCAYTVRVLIYHETTNEWKDSITKFATVNFTGWDSITVSSADVLTVAVGVDNSIEMYHLSKKLVSNNTCHGNVFHFTIQPDRFPEDISWLLQDQAGGIVIGAQLPTDDIDRKNTFDYIKCLENNSTAYYFYIQDEYGDGICCDWGNGHFTLKWNNETVMNGANFKSKNHMCLPRSSNLIPMSIHAFDFRRGNKLVVWDSNGNILLSRKGNENNDENVMLYQCVPNDECINVALLNIAQVSIIFLNDSFNQTYIPTTTTTTTTTATTNLEIFHVGDCDTPSCPPNYSFFEFNIGTGAFQPVFASDFSWQLLGPNNEILMIGDDDRRLPNEIYHYQGCVTVSQNDCATLMLYYRKDEGGIYYDVLWNGNEIASGIQRYGGLDIAMGNCSAIACEKTQSLLQIYWTESQYFFWELLDPINNTLTSGGSNNQTSNYRGCVSVTSDKCATLVIYDRNDDVGAIRYRVVWDGDELAKATLVGPFDKITLGNCSIVDVCPENYSLFEMSIKSDWWPEEFSWELLNSNDTILYNGKGYEDEFTGYHNRGCVAVSQNECAVLMLYDCYYDGGTYYDIYWNGDAIANGTQGTHDLKFEMGSCDGGN